MDVPANCAGIVVSTLFSMDTLVKAQRLGRLYCHTYVDICFLCFDYRDSFFSNMDRDGGGIFTASVVGFLRTDLCEHGTFGRYSSSCGTFFLRFIVRTLGECTNL